MRMSGSILTLACIQGVPSLKVRERADPSADRALAESGRHALDMATGQRPGTTRPDREAVRSIIRRAARRLPPVKLPSGFTLPAVPLSVGACVPLPC